MAGTITNPTVAGSGPGIDTGAPGLPTGRGALAGGAAGGAGGYQGLGGILSWLAQGGINAQAYANMGVGANGNNGYGVQGSHGALRGLSPQAVAWMQANLMQANSPAMASLFGTNADGSQGAALTGHDLLMAQLHNSLAGLAPKTYGLKSGDESLTADDLAGLFGTALGGTGGANPYTRGYNATGETYADRYNHYVHQHDGHDASYNQWLKAHKKLK